MTDATNTQDRDGVSESSNMHTARPTYYEERIDCSASCCWGCKEDQVEAKVAGGKVC